jgi:hypothetical protein
MFLTRLFYSLTALLVFFQTESSQAQHVQPDSLIKKFRQLSNASIWTQVAAITLPFPAHHPQGMVRVGPYFFMSSVEVVNREAGRGAGHLFKFDGTGKLLADLKLGEGPIYHPGGLDFDGQHIWVSVAEYRPNSRSIVYRVSPTALTVTEVFRFDDHLGGVVHDTDSHTLYAVSWGSRTLYNWKLGDDRFPADKGSKAGATLNPAFYVDYQDCHYVGRHLMLCGGVKSYQNGQESFRLGGLELVDLTSHQPVHQIPLLLKSPSGRPMTQNPFWLESIPNGLRAWFVPDDDKATMYVYEISLK